MCVCSCTFYLLPITWLLCVSGFGVMSWIAFHKNQIQDRADVTLQQDFSWYLAASGYVFSGKNIHVVIVTVVLQNMAKILSFWDVQCLICKQYLISTKPLMFPDYNRLDAIYTEVGVDQCVFFRDWLLEIKKTENRYLGLIFICSKNENYCDTILTNQ